MAATARAGRRNVNTMASDVEAKVRDIISEQLGVAADEVTPEASFIEDLGADSLDIVELVMALEEEYGMEIWTKTPRRSARSKMSSPISRRIRAERRRRSRQIPQA